MDARRPKLFDRAADATIVAIVISVTGTVTACVGMTLDTCGALVWTDLLHVNPYRTISNVLEMMLLSPIYGSVLGIALLGPAVVAGGMLAGLSTLTWRPPSSTGMAGVAIASSILFVRWCYVGAEAAAETPDWRQESPPWFTLIGGVLLLTASLYGGWWVARRLK